MRSKWKSDSKMELRRQKKNNFYTYSCCKIQMRKTSRCCIMKSKRIKSLNLKMNQ